MNAVPTVNDPDLINIFAILSNQLRWDIFLLIKDKQRISSADITKEMGISQPLSHFHTKALHNADLIMRHIGSKNRNIWTINEKTLRFMKKVFELPAGKPEKIYNIDKNL